MSNNNEKQGNNKKKRNYALTAIRHLLNWITCCQSRNPMQIINTAISSYDDLIDIPEEKEETIDSFLHKRNLKTIKIHHKYLLKEILIKEDIEQEVIFTGNWAVNNRTTLSIIQISTSFISIPFYVVKEPDKGDCIYHNIYKMCVSDLNLLYIDLQKYIARHANNLSSLAVNTKDNNVSLKIKDYELHQESDSFIPCQQEKNILKNLQFSKESRSILLHGQPGTGKSTMVARLAIQLGRKMLFIDFETILFIIDNIPDDTISNMASAFGASILLLDDLDRIGRHKTNNLLIMLSHLKTIEGLTIIATANDISKFPKALCRPGRFDEIIEVPLPSEEERFQILRGYIRENNCCYLSNFNIRKLAVQTEGLSGAWLKELAFQTKNLDLDGLINRATEMKEFINN